MDDLPKSLYTDKIASLAVTICQEVFEKYGWKFRRETGSTDFGIDSEIEIVDNNLVTGKIFKCQIKGTSQIKWEREETSIYVKISTYNYWKSINLPVIILMVDIKKKVVFWSIPLTFTPKIKAKYIKVKFFKENNLDYNFNSLKHFIESWSTSFSSEGIPREVPSYHSLYKELSDQIDWGDPWCQVDKDIDFKVMIFYKHVLQLRLSLGLSNNEIIPLDHWYIRSASIWNDDYSLFHAVFSELMKYIKSYYDEAFEKLSGRLKNIEMNFENKELINFFKLHPIFDNLEVDQLNKISVSFEDERFYDENFHKIIEEKLEKIEALKFRWQPKNRK